MDVGTIGTAPGRVRRLPRSRRQQWKDFFAFPFRAFLLFPGDRWGLSSLRTERYEFAAAEVRGYCLDVGCGPHNRFVEQFLGGDGLGIDVYRFDGLTPDQIIQDVRRFPFEDGTFDTITMNAMLNHIPRRLRDIELAEAYRCLKPGGNIVITIGNPVAEIAVHYVLWLYDRFLGTHFDLDNQRGMDPEETYFVLDAEILDRLRRQGFVRITKKYFWTQWALNHLFVGWKPRE